MADPQVFATDTAKAQAEAFILDYYRKFDTREAAEAFANILIGTAF